MPTSLCKRGTENAVGWQWCHYSNGDDVYLFRSSVEEAGSVTVYNKQEHIYELDETWKQEHFYKLEQIYKQEHIYELEQIIFMK